MGIHKDTIARVTKIADAVRRELQGFQVYKFTKEPELGIFNIKMFGIRIKCLQRVLGDDVDYRLIHVFEEDELDKNKLFLELASSGYLRWIRDRYSTHGFLALLMHDNRAEMLMKAAKARAKHEKKGEFRVKYIDSLLRRPLIEVYHEDPTLFDWILL